MLIACKGIVLHHIKYNETSVIAKIYTDLFGLQSYIIKGIRASKSKNKLSLLEHLSLIEIVAYHKNMSSGLKTVKEIKSIYRFQSIPFDIYKSSIALFINEILYKSLKEDDKNDVLFDFLFQSIQFLDVCHNKYINFHLLFMLQYAKLLGFYPRNNFDKQHPFFNLNEGVFQSNIPMDAEFIALPYSEVLNRLQSSSFENMYDLEINSYERRFILEKLILFYRLHLDGFAIINSHKILQEIL
jgi:DNA repair protein RecO (recombination protein O)